MAYKVTAATWLTMETERVRKIILMPRFWGKRWNPKKLQDALNDLGLDYSRNDVQDIIDQLIADGVLEELGE